MCGNTARLTRCVLTTLMSYSSANCCGLNASAGPNTMCPALCTTTSMRPLALKTFSIAESTEDCDCTSISTVRRSTHLCFAKSAAAALHAGDDDAATYLVLLYLLMASSSRCSAAP